MAGVVGKVLKVAAGAAVASGAYLAGRKAGADELGPQAAGFQDPPVGDGRRAIAEPTVSAGASARSDLEACAQALKLRIAEQALSNPAAPALRSLEASGEGAPPLTATLEPAPDTEAASAPEPAQEPPQDGGAGQDDQMPYQQIHDAISSSDFFGDDDGQKAKPAEFRMP